MFSLKKNLSAYTISTQVRSLVMGRTLRVDSRQIQPGDVFVACQGEYTDGRNYIQAAIDNGAVFVFWDDDGKFNWQKEWHIPNVGIEDLK